MPTNPFRLPRHAVPTRYELVLQPDLEAAVFSGTASIDLSVTEPTSELVLNAAELSISKASLTTADGDEVPATVTLDEKLERAHVTLSRQIEAGVVRRSPQRPTARLLPEHLHRRHRR